MARLFSLYSLLDARKGRRMRQVRVVISVGRRDRLTIGQSGIDCFRLEFPVCISFWWVDREVGLRDVT